MPGPHPIRILSVEDHPVFREGLSRILSSQPDMLLVAQAANAEEALAEFRRHRPDITLMDLRLPGTNGIDALIAIRGEFPRARVIMLSTSESDGEIQRAMRAGAAGYLLKSMPKDQILDAIRSVHAGKKHVPAEVAARLAEHLGEEDLTTRELDVLRLIRDGHRNKQIADRLGIAETTVNIVRVADNGVGIDPSIVDEGKTGHFDLQGLRERAARIGAKLTVVSSANMGTEITLVVPGSIVFRKPDKTPSEKLMSLLRGIGRRSKRDRSGPTSVAHGSARFRPAEKSRLNSVVSEVSLNWDMSTVRVMGTTVRERVEALICAARARARGTSFQAAQNVVSP